MRELIILGPFYYMCIYTRIIILIINKRLKEICPRGNNNIVIIIFLVHDNVYTPC
jgi:hypothetical protein